MPRPRRVHIEGAVSYIHQDAQEGIDLFKSDEDYAAYIRLLKEYQEKYQLELFSYALTPQKVHLLLEPKGEDSTSQFMRDVTSRYSKYYNGSYGHSGSLFHGRFKTVLVQKGMPFEEVKNYLSSLAASSQVTEAFAYAGNVLQEVNVQETLTDALRSTAYGSAEFVERVKDSMKAGHTADVASSGLVSARLEKTPVLAASAKGFSLGFTALAGTLIVATALGTNFWLAQPRFEVNAAVQNSEAEAAVNKESVSAETLVEAKSEKKMVVILDGTEWNVQLIPTEGPDSRNRKVEFDQLKFSSNRVASQKFATNGYDAAHYTLSQTPEGVIVWETIQRNSNGEMVSWRGEWAGESMKGVLSRQLTDGKAQVFNFIGTLRDGSVGPAAGKLI